MRSVYAEMDLMLEYIQLVFTVLTYIIIENPQFYSCNSTIRMWFHQFYSKFEIIIKLLNIAPLSTGSTHQNEVAMVESCFQYTKD